MTHLAPRPGFFLAIKMQGAAFGKRFPGIGLGADDVFHHRIGMADGIAKRPSRHGANMLLELGTLTGFDGPMAAIVDPRRHLVEDRRACQSEEFHRHHPDIVERVGDPAGERLARRDRRIELGPGGDVTRRGCRPRGGFAAPPS